MSIGQALSLPPLESVNQIYDALDQLAPQFEAEARASEIARRPTQALGELMRKARIPMSKVPTVVGGCEISPSEQIDFFARISYLNPTAGWIAFNQSGVLGLLCANLPEEGVEKLFSLNACPLVSAVSAPTGRSEKVEGGYRVSGKWAYASGIACADAVFLSTICPDPAGAVGVLIPTDQVELHDDWNVAALQGTGSVDVLVDDVFVPEAFSCSPFVQLRGGPQYTQLGYRIYVGGENFGFTLGVARRMVEEITRLSLTKKRVLDPTPVSDRGAFQQELGRTDSALRAARAYLKDELDRAFDLVQKNKGPLSPHALARAEAAVSWATETSIQACTRLFPYAGAGALNLSSPIQRSYRDLIGSGQHLVATNETLDTWGKSLLEQAQNPQ
ncbi:MAG: hypothetical protein CL917_05475 [Deltaproteobacteria bacterium]|nr:hypothetical protein [Deltaproteobacteria bacterium]